MRLLLLIAIFVSGCSQPAGEVREEKVVAVAGTEKLGVAEFRESLLPFANPADSTAMAQKVIDRWAADALLYQEALEQLENAEVNVEAQVAEYRRSLLNHIYASRLVEGNLDTAITREEVENYYNEHRESFMLKENIVKVFYIKVPVRSKALQRLKRLVTAVTPKDKEELKNLCLQNAESFFINDSTWLFLDDIRKEMPALQDQPELALNTGRVVEFTDADYYYYLRIKDVKIKNSLSPLNFERRNIRNFILNGRKAQLIAGYKQQLLDKARSEKKLVITGVK